MYACVCAVGAGNVQVSLNKRSAQHHARLEQQEDSGSEAVAPMTTATRPAQLSSQRKNVGRTANAHNSCGQFDQKGSTPYATRETVMGTERCSNQQVGRKIQLLIKKKRL